MYPRSHFFQKETSEMNVSESVHVIYRKKYRNRENIHEDMSEYKFLEKKSFFFSGFDPTGLSTFKALKCWLPLTKLSKTPSSEDHFLTIWEFKNEHLGDPEFKSSKKAHMPVSDVF